MKVFVSTIWFALWVISTASFAELDVTAPAAPQKDWPDTIILDWQTLNIDFDQKRVAAQALKQSQTELAKKILGVPAPQTLDLFAPVSPTNDSSLKRALATALAGNRGTAPLLMIPAWTSLRGQQVFLLVVADSRTNVVLATTHEVIPLETWRKGIQTKAITGILSGLLDRLWNQATAKPFATHNPDIAVGLNLATVSERANEMERNALNLIFATQHFNSYTIVNPLAHETLATIHRAWNAVALLRRPNRNLTFAWNYPESTAKQSLPLKLSLVVKPTEGVFAQPLTWQTADTATITVDAANHLQISIPAKLTEQLAVEEVALKRQEMPMAAKIRGAWVYLDKGRAWGLKMNDRLVISDGSSTVKGHIVGYFGPELQIKSPRGYPIHEGAILFVRKGQQNAKIGEVFAYDTMEVPTPWPPKQTTDR